jgi:hypothetical protein
LIDHKEKENQMLAKRVAKHLKGRDLLYKSKGFMGPVHVDRATCDATRILVTMTTRPWSSDRPPYTFELDCPVEGTSADGFRVVLNAGYGINGIFIHAPAAINALEALRAAGASVQDMLDIFNFSRGIPDVFIQFRDLTFPGWSD